uniref:Uncharacterized protein n=1 Tax=Schistosoma haematobium TaxID=6185 RepID=A0A094ZFR6_SCHHA
MFSNIKRKLTHPRPKPNSSTAQCLTKKDEGTTKKDRVEFVIISELSKLSREKVVKIQSTN